MKALLLAAGLGTRLRPLTDLIPKCLSPIQGVPLIDIWIQDLLGGGVDQVLVNLHYFPEFVGHHLSQISLTGTVRSVFEVDLLGTGGTLLKNEAFFRSNHQEEPFFVIHADNLSYFSVSEMIECHRNRPRGTEVTMMTFSTETPKSCGIVELDSRGIVQAFHEKVEKPVGNLANGAIYVFEPSIFDLLRKKEKSFIDLSTEILPFMAGKINTFYNSSYHSDIGSFQSLLTAQVEYPRTVLPLERRNPWYFSSGIPAREYQRGFLSSLAEGLGSTKTFGPNTSSSILLAKSFSGKPEEVVEKTAPLLRYNPSLLIVFLSVPFSFNSHSFYKKTGYRCIALAKENL